MNASTGERASGVTALFTDLYELTMLGAYGLLGMDAGATFSLFVRELPASRNFLIACGLDDLLDELEGFRFHEQDISYLRSLNLLPRSLIEALPEFRFTGDVFAVGRERRSSPASRFSRSLRPSDRRRWSRRSS